MTGTLDGSRVYKSGDNGYKIDLDSLTMKGNNGTIKVLQYGGGL